MEATGAWLNESPSLPISFSFLPPRLSPGTCKMCISPLSFPPSLPSLLGETNGTEEASPWRRCRRPGWTPGCGAPCRSQSDFQAGAKVGRWPWVPGLQGPCPPSYLFSSVGDSQGSRPTLGGGLPEGRLPVWPPGEPLKGNRGLSLAP